MDKILNSKLILLIGLFLGMLTGVFCMKLQAKQMNAEIWKVDLGKIIKIYSMRSAQNDFSDQEIRNDFLNKFENIVINIPSRVILVNEIKMLSKQNVKDQTRWFLDKMELNDESTNKESHSY